MRHRRTSREPGSHGVNVTPMIDVVMCLIIFFLMVGKLAADRGKEVRLPETRYGQSDKAEDTMVVDVVKTQGPGAAWLAGAGQASVGADAFADGAALEMLIRERLRGSPAAAVEIRADRDLTYSAVEPVLQACAKAGARNVRLATEKRP